MATQLNLIKRFSSLWGFGRVWSVVLAASLVWWPAASAYALRLNSQHVYVVQEDTGEVLVDKAADTVVPIASLTKLMTAMVVLDAKPDLAQKVQIDAEDVDQLKHSKSHVPVGTTLPRSEILRLALMASDNRAAAALARNYPGGEVAFERAVQQKIQALGMRQTVMVEPTGLSPENRSTAADLAKMARAAGNYPDIVRITTVNTATLRMNGHPYTVHNTNHLVGAPGWHVLLSKTGFTNEAGHCLIMRFRQAGKKVTLVLLNAQASAARILDARLIQKLAASKQH